MTELAATTTAGFKGVTATAGATALNVTAADAAAAVSIKLDGVKGNAGNVVAATVAGSKLNSVSVAGTLAQTTATAGAAAASLALDVIAGKDVQSVSVNTAVNTVLTVANDNGLVWTSTKDVNAIDASASTGAIKFNVDTTATPNTVGTGNTAVATLKTGAGNDVVGLSTALTSTVKAASVATGAGDDSIIVNVNATGAVKGSTVTVDAGAGKDKIALNVVGGENVTYNVNAGAGDDTVTIAGAIKSTDVIDGGEGTDTVALEGATSYNVQSYVTLNKVLKNFEAIQFTTIAGGTTAFDASQTAAYKSFTFDKGGKITKVAADQAVITADDLSATATGYVAKGTDGATATTYAGTLNVTASGGNAAVAAVLASNGPDGLPGTADDIAAAPAVLASESTVTAFAESIALTAKATTAASFVGLTGDVKSATVTLTNSVNAATNPTADTIANFNLTTAVTAPDLSAAQTSLGNLTTLTLTGNGSATVTNGVGTSLVTVDASQLGGVYTLGTDAGKAISGLTYTSDNAKAETITLGAGVDNVTLNASTYAASDTIKGLNLVLDATKKALTATSDDIDLLGGAKTFTKFVTTQTDLDLALLDAGQSATANDVVFQLGDNTYIYQDAGNNGLDAADTLVTLTGAIDLDALIVALA